MEKIKKTCILKRVRMLPRQRDTFATLLESAVGTLATAESRRMEISRDSGRYRLLNDFTPAIAAGASVSGSVFSFTMDANMNGVLLDPNSPAYRITELAPTRTEMEHEEFVEGLTWFTSVGNYIAVLSCRNLQPEVLEDYFSWLLTKAEETRAMERGQTFDGNICVNFSDPVPPALGDYDMSRITAIEYCGTVETEHVANSNAVRPKGRAHETMCGIFRGLGEQLEFPNDEYASEAAIGPVRVRLSISCPKRALDNGGGEVLRRMADTLKTSAAGSADVQFSFADGRRLDASELKITTELTLSASNKLPNPIEAVRKLDEWMSGQVRLLENP